MKLIACEILYREICAVVARSTNQVDVEFLPKGLHDQGQIAMHARLAEALSAVDETAYDAIALGYGLCSNGMVGLQARTIRLVLPRAHDCITLFLGSKEKYHEYFFEHPGVFFKTTGWLERGGELSQYMPGSIQTKSGMIQSYEEMVARYGEDNAKFLQKQLGDLARNYGQITFIETGVEPDDRFEQQSRDEAAARGWRFERLRGDLCLFQKLVNGQWDEEDFLVVPPGKRIAASYDEWIVKAE
ncbi:MAG: DUF1638 domain-containing protein [Pirellulales bacterium]|nr:DUF1638 domain-containing protein [Pirellulales bacterium]